MCAVAWQVLTKHRLVSEELAATVMKFVADNQTHGPGQTSAAAAPPPSAPKTSRR